VLLLSSQTIGTYIGDLWRVLFAFNRVGQLAIFQELPKSFSIKFVFAENKEKTYLVQGTNYAHAM